MNDGFSYYWKVLQRRMPIILLVSVVAAAVAFVGMKQIRPTYEVHFSYLISLSEREPASDFRFDGYYALEATDLFAATLARWIQTPEVIEKAYETAQIEDRPEDARQLGKTVNSEKTAPQLVQVTVSSDDRGEAERLSEGLKQVMQHNVEAYHDQGVPAARFTAVPTDSWTGVVKPAAGVVVAAVFVFFLFVGVNVVLLAESLRSSSLSP